MAYLVVAAHARDWHPSGARRRIDRVVALIVGRGVRLAVIGVAIGGAAALGLTRLLDGMLFGVTATDPIAFASVIALTLTAVLVATWVPASAR